MTISVLYMVLLNIESKYKSLNSFINNYVYRTDSQSTKLKIVRANKYGNDILDQLYGPYYLKKKKKMKI